MSLLNIFSRQPKPKNLQEYMKIQGFSRREFAQFLGITESYLSYLLNDKRKLGKEKAIETSRKTRIPLRNLIQ